MATGYIPERIVMVFSDAITTKNKAGEEINVVPAFPVDAKNKKRLETADTWALRGNYRNGKGQRTVTKQEYPNGPFKDVKINALEIRGEGGRAYKVVVGDDYYVDFREDELMWVMQNPGIRPGGIMNGEFCFAVVGSQTKLIPIGSPLWDSMQQATKRKEAKELKASEFKVGNKYRRKDTREFIIVAEVNVPKFTLRKETGLGAYRYGRKVYLEKVGKVEKHFLIWNGYQSPAQDVARGCQYSFQVIKAPSAIEDLGVVPSQDMCTFSQVKGILKSNYSERKEHIALLLAQDASIPYVPNPYHADGSLIWSANC